MVFNMTYDRLAGLYTFPIPTLSNTPTLYVDRKAGAQVIRDAKEGKKATLRLLAKSRTRRDLPVDRVPAG